MNEQANTKMLINKEDEQSLREDVFNALRILSAKDNLTQRDLSNHLGVSLGKTNYLLKSLIKKNLVKIKNFSKGGGKLKKVKYILTKRGFEEKMHLTYYFLKRKEEEYLGLKKELETISNKVQKNRNGVKV